jgi:hypothetical protein
MRPSCLAAALAGAVLAASLPAAAEEIEIEIENGRLSAAVGEVPLVRVLEAIGEVAGFEVGARGEVGDARPQRFEDLPLEQGIRRLAGPNGVLIRWLPGEEGERRIAAVTVVPRVETAALPQPRQPPQMARGAAASPAQAIGRYDQIARMDAGGRARAIDALARSGDPMAQEVLAEALARDPDPGVRRQAAAVLAGSAGPAALGALETALVDGDPGVRIEALRAQAQRGGEEAVDVLASMVVRDEEPSVRRVAAQLLARDASPEALFALEDALDDPDPDVRAIAEAALQ